MTPLGPEQLAEVVHTQPEKLRESIAASTLDQLNALAKVIEDKKIPIRVDSIVAIQERVDTLNASKTTDERLEELKSRFNLVRLLAIKAPDEATTSKLDFAASFINGAAERTKDIPVLKHVTGLLKGIKGRSIERLWFTILATLEKNPAAATTAGTAILGPVGLLVGTLGLNFGARKRLLEISVLDAIDAEKLVGENIIFSGVAPGDPEKFKDKLTTANIPELTTKYLRDQRKLIAAGSPITVTLEAILNPETTQTKLAEQAVETKKKTVIDALKPLGIALVTFGTPVSAKRNNAGRLEITIPDTDNVVTSPEARTLQEAMKSLPNAKEITIVSERERLTIDMIDKTIRIPVNTPEITNSLNRGFLFTNQRLEKIVFATVELPNTVMQAKLNDGTLLLGANSLRSEALEHISGLELLLGDAPNGTLFTFQNGSWAAPALPTSIPTV